MILRVLGIVLLGLAAYWAYNFYASPPTVASAGVPIVTVNVPTLSAADKIGEAAFNNNCASCHGANAAGQEGVAPPLVHKIYEPNHHGDMAFVMAAKRGVRQHHWRFGNMPSLPDVSTKDMTEIIAYVRTLQRANGIN